MSEFKGTPGEWYVRYGGTGDHDGFGIATKGLAGVDLEHVIVAEHWPCTVTLPSRKTLAADAHLIASAPDLLAALQELLTWHGPGSASSLGAKCWTRNEAEEAARTAITKAIGTKGE